MCPLLRVHYNYMKDSNLWLILFEILINLYEGALYIFFCNSVFHSHKRHLCWAILFSVLIGIAYSLYSFFEIPLTDACVFVLPIIYSLIVFDTPPVECVFWNIIMGTFVFGCVNLCYAIYTIFLAASISHLMTADFCQSSLCNIHKSYNNRCDYSLDYSEEAMLV